MRSEMNDLDLVNQVAKGLEGAFEELLERYSTRVMNLALRITRNQEDAEEVLQDVFITIFKKVATFENRAAFSSWLYRVTMNASFMKIRARNRRRTVSMEEIDPHEQEKWSTGRSDTSSIEYLTTSHELRHVLQDAIDALPYDYRAIFVLRDVDGLSNQATSEILGLSVPAVKSRLHRARVLLRESLQSYKLHGEKVGEDVVVM